MNKKELEKLKVKVRSSTIGQKVIKVIYLGRAGNFEIGKIYEAKARHVMNTGKGFPYPKWKHCDYRIKDEDGDVFHVSDYGVDFNKGFYPVSDDCIVQQNNINE